MVARLKTIAVLLSALLLCACNNAPTETTIARIDQSISFNDVGPINKLLGDARFSNTATKAADGNYNAAQTTYTLNVTASAPATPADQTISFSDAGPVTKTMGDDNYTSAQANYTINILPPTVQIDAWVGATDTLVKLPSDATGFDFYRATEANCDLANYSLCANGQLDRLNTLSVTDTATTSNRTAWYWLKQGARTSTAMTVTHATFSARDLHQVVAFNNKLWLIGGWDGGPKNDIWSSSNGVTWTQVSASAPFSARTSHQVLAFNNKLWLIGGYDTDNKNDVWSSSDGISWTQEAAAAAFSARTTPQALAFDNKLWLIAGQDSTAQNDVWASDDGTTWRRGYRNVFAFP